MGGMERLMGELPAPRGDPATPEPYDGYLIEKPKGWQGEAMGIVVCGGKSYEDALAIVGEHVGEHPIWRVNGGTERVR